MNVEVKQVCHGFLHAEAKKADECDTEVLSILVGESVKLA